MKLNFIKNKLLLLIVLSLVFFVFSCKKEDSKSSEVTTPVVAYAKVDKTQATLGDTITYELTLNYAQKIKLETPEIKNIFTDFTITKQELSKPNLVDSRFVQTYKYKLQVKELGAYTINPIEVTYHVPPALISKYGKDDVAKTSKIFIEVKSVLKPEDKNADIDDIKPIEQISVLTTSKIILIGLVVLLLIAGLIYLVYLFKKEDKKLLAHEIAYKELTKLKELDLVSKGEIKTFYFNLSEILRGYLKNRFMLPALEQASEELQKELNKNPEIAKEQKAFLIDFLEKTDFYKFTDAVSEKGLATKLFEQTQNFVEITKEIPEKEKKK